MRVLKAFVAGMLVFCGVAYAASEPTKKIPTSKYYVDQGLAEKQKKLTGTANTVVLYPTSEEEDPGSKPISDHLTATGTETQSVLNQNLPTVGAVNTGLNTKQAKVPAKAATKVVTYTATAGTIGEHDIYQSTASTYNSAGLIEAQHANSAIRKGLNEHLTCATNGTQPGTSTCWLWQINDQAEGTVYTPRP